jgi:hypothetical protein
MTSSHPTGRVPAFPDLGSRPLPDRISRQVHRIPPGGRLDCPQLPWNDALALVDVGCVELRLASGADLHLGPGAIFSLRGLTPALLTAANPGPAVLITLCRRTEGETP